MKTPKENKANDSILSEIRDSLREGNASLKAIHANTRKIRQDLSGIREGRTGIEARLHKDPLSAEERFQVDLVKTRYYNLRQRNPLCSLLAVAKGVRREMLSLGRSVFASDLALNHRAWMEIKREDKGLPPF